MADSMHDRRMRGKMKKAHPGFKAVQEHMASEQGVSMDRAGAMLAESTRRAGPAARRKNPRLNKVRGGRYGK